MISTNIIFFLGKNLLLLYVNILCVNIYIYIFIYINLLLTFVNVKFVGHNQNIRTISVILIVDI
jgi:hypothetical protein